jgi:hypothetical protein
MHVRDGSVILELAAGCAVVAWLYLILGRGLFWRLRESEATGLSLPHGMFR